jgi:hypothetical protein
MDALTEDACTFFRVTPEEIRHQVKQSIGTPSPWNYLHWARCEWEYGWPQAVANGLRDYHCESVLDFGSGVGEVALHVAGWNDCSVTMCDLPGPWADFASWRAKRREYLSVRGPVHPYEVRRTDQTFDAVLLLEVVEHLPDAEETLRMLCAKTRRALCVSGVNGRPSTDKDPLHVYSKPVWPLLLGAGFVLVRGGGMPWWFLRSEVAEAEGVPVLNMDGTERSEDGGEV